MRAEAPPSDTGIMLGKRLWRNPPTFFVSLDVHEKQTLFADRRFARAFLDSLLESRTRGDFFLHEFVLMPSNFHALLTPVMGVSLERMVQVIKGESWRSISQKLDYHLPLWRVGFDYRRIRSASDYAHYKIYIQREPLRAKLVPETRDYFYSSRWPALSKSLDPWPPKHLREVRLLATKKTASERATRT